MTIYMLQRIIVTQSLLANSDLTLNPMLQAQERMRSVRTNEAVPHPVWHAKVWRVPQRMQAVDEVAGCGHEESYERPQAFRVEPAQRIVHWVGKDEALHPQNMTFVLKDPQLPAGMTTRSQPHDQ